jgi:O-antigen ligase/tetratricopeptide (TPR) repeat protein
VRIRLIDLTDRAVIGGLVLLVLATPLCFGTAHPWAYQAAEAVIFSMLAVALLRMRAAQPEIRGAREILGVVAPAPILIVLVGFQLVPLPPALVRVLSPGAYDLYRHTLDGWPSQIEFPPPTPGPAESSTSAARPVLMPTESEVRNGAPVPFVPHHAPPEPLSLPVVGRMPRSSGWYGGIWRSLSLSPPLGIASALKLVAAFGLIAIVALYPVAREASESDEDPLTRLLVSVILISGFAVAAIGIVQQVTWNGKVLWFFVPLDWGGVKLGHPRMMGSFINPDHFAAYLAMTAPLFMSRACTALAGDDGRNREATTAILCSSALVVVVCAILLSESRAIWGATLVLCALFLILASRFGTPAFFRERRGAARAWAVGLGVVALAALPAALIGSAGRDLVDTRVGQSVAGGLDFWHRVHIWRDTLRMVPDYPLFGVGLGAWPEVFPHYRIAPWPTEFLRDAHNGYVEFAAELGVLGVAALVAIGWKAARLIRRRWPNLTPRAQLTVAGLISGVAVEGFHELFDFSLTVPAISFLFAIYAALLMRIAVTGIPETESAIRYRRGIRAAAPFAAAMALALVIASQVQASVIYPYYPRPKTFADAGTMVLLHPANAGLHLALASWYGSSPAGIEQVSQAVWIDKRDPFARDLFARYLAENGRIAESLDQIAVSVMWAPRLGDHLYLNPRIVPYLAPPERRAIEQGLREAIARGYPEAVGSLASFYTGAGLTLDAARVYESGAASADDIRRRVQFLMLAGEAYAQAGQLDRARRDFEQARAADPEDPRPYSALMSQVFVARKDVAGATSLLKEGLGAGVDAAPLFPSFAQVAHAAGQPKKARAALTRMVEYDPSFDSFMRLGSYYAAERDYTRASEVYRRATDINPANPRAWLELAGAEEGAYQYEQANRDYRRAAALGPSDVEVSARFAAFKQKLAAGHPDATADSGQAVALPAVSN